jgi:formylmethanofuran dehydrogenase subunit E
MESHHPVLQASCGVKDYRCPQCNRLLFQSDAPAGNVKTVCRTCMGLKVVHLDPKKVKPQTTAR